MKSIARAALAAVSAAMFAACSGGGDGTGAPGRPSVNLSSGTDAIRVEWTAVEGALSYEIQYSIESDMSGASSQEASGTSSDIEGIDTEATYYVMVRARLGSGWGEWSDTMSYSPTGVPMTVETYNILNESAVAKSPWPNRREAWKQNVLKESNFPDILGLQECHSANQRNDIIAMLKGDYNYYVSPKADISPAVVFWKKERFILVSTEVFDMLPTTEYPSSSYKGGRYALHVRLRERSSGQELLIFNIHLPAASSLSTKEKLILHNKMVASLAPHVRKMSEDNGNIPAIVMGDMNGYPDTTSDGIQGPILTFKSHGFKDTYDMTANRTNPDYRTYNSQDDVDNCTATYAANGSRRIDYVLVWPENRFKVSDYEIVINFTDKANHKVQCPLPSDHNPVKVGLKIK